uniref:Peptidase S1 domain-containing protein n=1 Tax=Anopheles atroparvus TaxID=41427 RepID=A0AAG5D0H7_ANOAO
TIQIRTQPQPQPVFVQTRLPSPQPSLPTIPPRPTIIQPRPPAIQPTPPPETRLEVVQAPRPQPQSIDVCGKPSPVYNKLSINGKLSPKGQFPWAVPIFDARPIKPKYICGSTILNKYHLVTAAHCMYDDSRKFRPSELVTMPGMYNIDNFFESDIQERDVASIIVHPDYDDYDNTGNDIALMVLQQAIIYTDLVRPICLWNGNDNIEDIVGRTGYVSGWGITEKGSAKKPS